MYGRFIFIRFLVFPNTRTVMFIICLFMVKHYYSYFIINFIIFIVLGTQFLIKITLVKNKKITFSVHLCCVRNKLFKLTYFKTKIIYNIKKNKHKKAIYLFI